MSDLPGLTLEAKSGTRWSEDDFALICAACEVIDQRMVVMMPTTGAFINVRSPDPTKLILLAEFIVRSTGLQEVTR